MYACDYDGHHWSFVKLGSGLGGGGRWSVVGGRWSVVGWPTDSRQIPGLLGPTVFAMILLGLAFSGHFSPKQFSQM